MKKMNRNVYPTLKEIKTKTKHCFVDKDNNCYGKYTTWYRMKNGHRQLQIITTLFKDDVIGEYMDFQPDGKMIRHQFYTLSAMVHDQLENPLSDEELLLLCLEHGFKRLPKLEKKEC